MKLKPETKVTTPWGPGIVKGYDLPESKRWRYMIELEGGGVELCFFPSEVEVLEDES